VHVYPTKSSGVDYAEGVVAALSPRTLLILRPPQPGIGPRLTLRGQDAIELAGEVNGLLVDQAYGW